MLDDLLTDYQDFQDRQQALKVDKERLERQSFINDCEILLSGYLADLSPGDALIGENGEFVLPVSYVGIDGYIIISNKSILQFGKDELTSKLSQKYPFTPIPFSDRQLAPFLLSIQKTASEEPKTV